MAGRSSPARAGGAPGLTCAAIQVAFTVFAVTETWLVPIEGWFVDKYGPSVMVLFGGVLCGIGWVMNSYADSLAMLHIAAAIGGTGAVYGTAVGNSLKWFPDRRGLAAGITAAMDLVAALLSLLVLKPLRAGHVKAPGVAAVPAEAGGPPLPLQARTETRGAPAFVASTPFSQNSRRTTVRSAA